MFEDKDKHFPISPVNFFQLSTNCFYLPPEKALSKKYLLPDTSSLCDEEHFADLLIGWNHEGIAVQASISEPFKLVSYPELTRGDSVELFFDTRDVKTSGYNTRFCHHFFFLPEAVEGHRAGEITRFRTEDKHDLCDSNELQVDVKFKNYNYDMHIFIPSQCLYGYDPDQFDRLGFTYRINRAGGESQHFSVISQDFQLEQQPSLWSSLILKK